MHHHEVETGPRLVKRLLAAQFPQWAQLPLEAVHSAGTVNAIYRLGADMAVRVPRVEEWARDLDAEVAWLPTLAPILPLAVPAPLGIGSPAADYPFRWAIYRWLPGEPWATERVADPHEAAAALAGFVEALHQVGIAGAPASRRGAPLQTQDVPTRKAIQDLAGTIPTDSVTAVWEASRRTPAWDRPVVWIHGDLLPPNLLLEDGRLRAVIDFGLAGVGDPAADMIPAWAVFDADERNVFRSGVHVDDATWARGRGWALSIALQIIPYYAETNPVLVEIAGRMVREILDDDAHGQ